MTSGGPRAWLGVGLVAAALAVGALVWLGRSDDPGPVVTPPPPTVPVEVVGKVGFFHLEKQGAAWWLVDPQGDRFVSIGINHVSPDFVLSDLNREQTLARYGPGFVDAEGAPALDGEALAAWHHDALAEIRSWGFNTLGWHNNVPQSEMPYVLVFRPAEIEYWVKYKKYPDPWAPAAAERIDALAREMLAPIADDPLVLGIAFNDVVLWEFEPGRRNQWIEVLMRKPAQTPGKRAWVDHLRGRYGTSAEAGRAYGIDAPTWEAFAAQREWPEVDADPVRTNDDALTFAPKLAAAWYALETAAVRRHAPNHLVLGDKINADPTLPEWLEPIIEEEFDLLFVEWRARFPKLRDRLREFHDRTGMPVLFGDSGFTTRTELVPDPKRVVVASSEQVGVEYARFMEATMREPYVVGWHYCGWMMGSPDLTGRYGMDRQYGFLEPDGTPHESEVRSATAANAEAVRWHAEGPIDPIDPPAP